MDLLEINQVPISQYLDQKAQERQRIQKKAQFIQFSCSVMSNSLWPHGLQHARLPYPSPAPGACSNLCPSSQWWNSISFSVVPFSSCLQSFPASGSFPMSQLFSSSGQSIGASASASVLPMNIQDWFPLGLTDLTSLQSKGLSRVSSNTTVQKSSIRLALLFYLFKLGNWSLKKKCHCPRS